MATNSVSVSCRLIILPWSGDASWHISDVPSPAAFGQPGLSWCFLTNTTLPQPLTRYAAACTGRVLANFPPTEPQELVLLHEWMNEWILFLSLAPQTAHVCTDLQCCHYSGNHTPDKTTGRTNSLFRTMPNWRSHTLTESTTLYLQITLFPGCLYMANFQHAPINKHVTWHHVLPMTVEASKCILLVYWCDVAAPIVYLYNSYCGDFSHPSGPEH